MVFIIIRSPRLSRNRLFSNPSPSRKGFSNSLYKSLIVVSYIQSALILIKIQLLILSFEGVIAFSYLGVIAYGGPRCDCLLFYLSSFKFYSLV